MINYLTFGIVLGLSAGLAPGPLMTLVISETLQHNIKSGLKVAIAPIITDFPIIFLTLLILGKLSHFHQVLGGVSIVGGMLVFLMGIDNLKTRGIEINFQAVKAKSLSKGILVNLLNPAPYLFWISVGAPAITKAAAISYPTAISFLLSFYVLLVGSKMSVGILVGKSKSFLTGNIYIYTMKILGISLLVMALFLIYDGLKLLNIM